MRALSKKALGFVLLSLCAFGGGDIGHNSMYINSNYLGNKNCFGGNCDKNSYYIDKSTNLMWEDMVIAPDCDAAYKRDQSACKAGNITRAKNFCETLNYAGFSDWRLPNSDELMDVSKQDRIFKNNRGADFWTSTQGGYGKHYAVFTVDGFRYERDDRQSNYIRCVRCITNDKPTKKTNLQLLEN